MKSIENLRISPNLITYKLMQFRAEDFTTTSVRGEIRAAYPLAKLGDLRPICATSFMFCKI